MSKEQPEWTNEGYRDGYEAAIEDVRQAIDESLNLAHLREALRYLKPRDL